MSQRSGGPTNKEMLQHIHALLHDEQHGLQAILAVQRHIERRIKRMSAETTAALARLTASVEANATVDASILALVEGLAQQIRDNAGDPTALNALADKLDADQAKIVAAVNANTPQPPNP